MRIINKFIAILSCVLMSFMLYMAGTGEPLSVKRIEAKELTSSDTTMANSLIINNQTSSSVSSPKVKKSASEYNGIIRESDITSDDIQYETPPVLADEPILVYPNNYNDYFSKSLLVGDSLTTGYSVYGRLNESLLVAQVGLSPEEALTIPIKGPNEKQDLVLNHIKAGKPENAIIMLGTDGMLDSEPSELASCVSSLCADINFNSPYTNIYLCTIPLTRNWYSNRFEYNYNEKIKKYNENIKDLAETSGYGFIDIQSALSTEDGIESKDEYIEPDGLHLSPPAYDVMVKFIFESIELSK